MRPQHVGPTNERYDWNDAAAPQPRAAHSGRYLFRDVSASLRAGYTQVAGPQNAKGIRRLFGFLRVNKTNRRQICPRASRAFVPCLCLSSWQHAATQQVTLKNLWSLTRFQLPLNPHTAASFNRFAEIWRQAFAPVASMPCLAFARPERSAA